MSYLLGLDLGTSLIKALLVTETGQIVGRGSAEYPILQPQPDRAEQDPEAWWQAALAAAQQALGDAEAGATSTAAIGLSGQMHGTVLLDAAGQPLTPAIIWPDRRSRRQVQEITQQLGLERLIEITGSPAATGFQAATLRWMQQERPEVWRQTRRVLLPKDYLRWRLTGSYGSDPSDGSGALLLDVRRRDWSPELLAALEIEPEKLPPIRASTAIAAELSRPAAEALGLPAGVPVVTGAADTACSALGAGVTAADTLLLTISSGGQMILPTMAVEIDPKGRLHTFCGALEPGPQQPGWYQMAAILSAGLSLRWLRDQVFALAGETAYAHMMAWAQEVPAGARGLLFLPYLAGERTPHMDPQASGLFLGLTTSHGRAELVRAVVEGVSLACYDAYQVLQEVGARPQRIIMAGGGARSQLWPQITADIFGLPVQALHTAEQSALGAALLAGAGVGLFDLVGAAREWAIYGPSLEPIHAHHTLYQALLPLFRSAYHKHRDDFRRLRDYVIP